MFWVRNEPETFDEDMCLLRRDGDGAPLLLLLHLLCSLVPSSVCKVSSTTPAAYHNSLVGRIRVVFQFVQACASRLVVTPSFCCRQEGTGLTLPFSPRQFKCELEQVRPPALLLACVRAPQASLSSCSYHLLDP